MIVLKRISQTPQGTLGELIKDGRRICRTCEDPWNDNKIGNSCIPAGVYDCVPHSGDKYKDVWRLVSVPGRKDILIHNGNTIKDTRGCILVGKNFGILNGLPSVTESVSTLNMLRAILPDRFSLEITNP